MNLDAVKRDKATQDEKIRLLTEKLEANQETSRREERLLLSAMYEVPLSNITTAWTATTVMLY